MAKQKERFSWWVKEPSFYKRLALLALPMAGQNIISFLVSLADNVMVAQLGDEAVGGVYVVNQIQNVLHMLVLGLGAALVILAAQYFGKGDVKSVKTLCATALRTAIGAGLLLLLVMGLFGRTVLGILTDQPGVIDAGMEYLSYIMWTYVFFSMSSVLLAGLRCAGTVHVGLIISLFTVITDVGLNYVMIFGKLGFPAMGISGAAASTLISRILEFVLVLFYVLKKDEKLKLRVKDFLLHNGKLFRDFFVYGFPVILGDFLWGLGGVAQAAIIGRQGDSVIAASAMTMNIFQIFAVFVYCTSGAGSLMVGQEIGRDNFDLAERYTKTLQVVYVMVGVASSLLLLSLRQVALSMYTKVDPQTLHYAGQFLLVMSVMLVGTSYQMSSLQIVRAGGATHFVLINDLVFVWLVVIPLSCLMAFVLKGPPWAIFACLKCDQILKCVVAAVKVNRFKWMKNLTGQME